MTKNRSGRRGGGQSVLLVAIVVVLVVSACGTRTTTALDDGRLDSQAADMVSDEPGLASGDEFSTGGGGPLAGGSSESRTSASARGGSAPRAPGIQDVDSRTGPGITADTIKIGIGWRDLAATAAIVAPGSDYNGSLRDAAEAVVRYMNKRGGIAGRRIEPLYHEYPTNDLTTKSGRDRREQAMCADWTEDRRAFVAVPEVASQGVFYECAAQKDLVVVVGATGAVAPVDQQWYQEIEHAWYSPHGMLADRREAMVVDQLNQSGFFGKDPKVGLVFWDSAPVRRVAERVTKPALAARGITLAATAYYPDPFAHDWPNTVLQFQTAGVTHVVFGSNGCGGVCSAAFMNAAESQAYRPFYGMSTDNEPAGMVGLAPAGQRDRIMAVVWAPQSIGGEQYESAPPINDNDARCREAKKESGVDLEQSQFAIYCDSLFFIHAALEAAPVLNRAAFRRAVEAPEFSFAPVSSWAAAFGPDRHDGPNAVRNLRYDQQCGCFQFFGEVRPLH